MQDRGVRDAELGSQLGQPQTLGTDLGQLAFRRLQDARARILGAEATAAGLLAGSFAHATNQICDRSAGLTRSRWLLTVE
jgi:hypothetical protein